MTRNLRLASLAVVASAFAGVTLSIAGQSPQRPSPAEFLNDLPVVRRIDRAGGKQIAGPFATYAQCQVELSVDSDPETALPVGRDENAKKIDLCLDAAIRERANVLVLPELCLALRRPLRDQILDRLRRSALNEQMVIIAGSYYDDNRQSRLPVIGPNWEELGYKIRPSRFESSPRHGRGMMPGEALLLISTPFGRVLPLTCVDLISDGAQYVVRSLATRGQVDVIANISFNPAAWEFMVEANSIARRHPVFVSITNVAGAGDPKAQEECRKSGDTGYCYGNSSLFANLREKDSDCPNCAKSILDLVERPFLAGAVRALPYDAVVAVVPPFQEALLVYELNLRMSREPATTNAPDQGYPTVRNARRVIL